MDTGPSPSSVVSYRNSTSNHNKSGILREEEELYLIEILHQTTTYTRSHSQTVLLYLIEILHQTTTPWFPASTSVCCILSKFYIKPQQRVRHKIGHSCCILSKFYIKPQRRECHHVRRLRCILSKFYIKPQQKQMMHFSASCCILSKFYIKPQLAASARIVCAVVSYRNSTSNHNLFVIIMATRRLYLIEILHQTTTVWIKTKTNNALYLIEILHQTTTSSKAQEMQPRCILSKFYIKPQPVFVSYCFCRSCILSKFYIKPQHRWCSPYGGIVVSYRNSTSNHNYFDEKTVTLEVVSYRNSTSNHNPAVYLFQGVKVVSYRNSTSNHNC